MCVHCCIVSLHFLHPRKMICFTSLHSRPPPCSPLAQLTPLQLVSVLVDAKPYFLIFLVQQLRINCKFYNKPTLCRTILIKERGQSYCSKADRRSLDDLYASSVPGTIFYILYWLCFLFLFTRDFYRAENDFVQYYWLVSKLCPSREKIDADTY